MVVYPREDVVLNQISNISRQDESNIAKCMRRVKPIFCCSELFHSNEFIVLDSLDRDFGVFFRPVLRLKKQNSAVLANSWIPRLQGSIWNYSHRRSLIQPSMTSSEHVRPAESNEKKGERREFPNRWDGPKKWMTSEKIHRFAVLRFFCFVSFKFSIALGELNDC